MPPDSFLDRIVSALAEVPGVAAIVLGGSRARGTDHANSDYDLGLYFFEAQPLDTGRLLRVARTLVDDPGATEVTPVGGWGPWIVGGGWLSVQGRKVDLLYRNIEAVAQVIEKCRAGDITMHYQAGHPHGFCSAIWMGEVALCRPLQDPQAVIAKLKAAAQPYPLALREAVIRRFRWEILFSIENAELAVSRGRANACRGLRLSRARLPGTNAVRAQWTLSHQRERRAAGSRRLCVDGPVTEAAHCRNLAADRRGQIRNRSRNLA